MVMTLTSRNSTSTAYPEIGKLLDSMQYVNEFQSYPVAVRMVRHGRASVVSARVARLRERRDMPWMLLGAVIAVFVVFAVVYTRITPIGASPSSSIIWATSAGSLTISKLPPGGLPPPGPPRAVLSANYVTGGDPRFIRLLLGLGLALFTILTVSSSHGGCFRLALHSGWARQRSSRCFPRPSTLRGRSTTTTSRGSPVQCSCSQEWSCCRATSSPRPGLALGAGVCRCALRGAGRGDGVAAPPPAAGRRCRAVLVPDPLGRGARACRAVRGPRRMVVRSQRRTVRPAAAVHPIAS